MPLKKRSLLLLAMSAITVVCGWLALSNAMAPSINRQAFERIQLGMSEEEVEHILGGPPGRYTNRRIYIPMEGTTFQRWWIGSQAVVIVSFDFGNEKDATRRVAGKSYESVPAETLDEMLRRIMQW